MSTGRHMHDWNRCEPDPWKGIRPRVIDETLRDGLQNPSVTDPPIDRKIAILHAMASIGVDVVSIGLPAAGPRAAKDAVDLGREIADCRLPLIPTAAARTKEGDVFAIADVAQRTGHAIDVYAFIGSSPIRQYVEGWDVAFLLERVREAGDAARKANLPYCLVMEDTTRSPPDVLREMFKAAIDVGARRLCLCDTVGHADPDGTRALVRWARKTVVELGAPQMELDWHGHNDRGLALGNALVAAQEGVHGVHGTAGGIGERCGNTSLEDLVTQLASVGARPAPRKESVDRYRELAASALAGDPAIPSEPLVPLRLEVNGQVIETAARPSRTLLELLRYDLGLTGSKQGCDKGDCGACTVLLDGEPVLSCLTLSLSCAGRKVVTVEALKGAPSMEPLIDAFDRRGAGQCGFCTPGMLMSTKALLMRNRNPTRQEIRESISGNLCRCTGYGAIVEAVEMAARIERGEEPSSVDLPGSKAPAPMPPHKERGP